MSDPAGADLATSSPDSLDPSEIRHQAAVQEALKETAPAAAASEKRHRPIPHAWITGLVAAALAVPVQRPPGAQAPRGAGHRFLRRLGSVCGLVRRPVSFGLLSLILGFALQTPITSFFAWIYILARSPYRVGDRIRIGEATGDVIDVGYLDTTLWEFGGEFLSTDHPSGRIIRFPNSKVFNSMVFNYSWPLFPYIWNEITVQVAYESDLEFVASVMKSTVEEEMGLAMTERVQVYRELLADTPVDHLEVEDKPTVLFRVNPNTWVDATVRYLVTPRRAGSRKTLLTHRILLRLNAEPGKVLFPKANLR